MVIQEPTVDVTKISQNPDFDCLMDESLPTAAPKHLRIPEDLRSVSLKSCKSCRLCIITKGSTCPIESSINAITGISRVQNLQKLPTPCNCHISNCYFNASYYLLLTFTRFCNISPALIFFI